MFFEGDCIMKNPITLFLLLMVTSCATAVKPSYIATGMALDGAYSAIENNRMGASEMRPTEGW
jgi:hypothetical protein